MASKYSETVLNTYDSDNIIQGVESYFPEHIREQIKKHPDLYEAIGRWILHEDVPDAFGHSAAPSDILTDDQLKYVYEHMQNDRESITRVEQIGTSVPKEDFVIGKNIKFNKPLKAFSETEHGTQDYMESTFQPDDELVIFKVKGNPSYFKTYDWSVVKHEQELWLDCRREYKVTAVYNKNYKDRENPKLMRELEEILGANFDYNVTFVELE